MVSEAPGAPAYAGVDTHKDTHTLALVDALGREVATRTFPADPGGYEALADAIGDTGVVVGVEGTRSYGRGLCDCLQARGYEVREVLRPKRGARRRGKSDPIDALAAAREVAAGRGSEVKGLDGAAGELRWLLNARELLVRQAARIASFVDSMLTSAPEGLRRSFPGSGAARIGAIARCEGAGSELEALRAVALTYLELWERADALEALISPLVRAACPLLAGQRCVGDVTAAELVVAAGSNPGRLGSEAAFSMLCGTSPIPASSGRTDRHRLNRGGDRRANKAIHQIVRVRSAHDPGTRDYLRRKSSEGKSGPEARRCCCRFVARGVYRALTSPQPRVPDARGLAARRRALGLTQARLGALCGMAAGKVSRLERGELFELDALLAYEAALDGAEARSAS